MEERPTATEASTRFVISWRGRRAQPSVFCWVWGEQGGFRIPALGGTGRSRTAPSHGDDQPHLGCHPRPASLPARPQAISRPLSGAAGAHLPELATRSRPSFPTAPRRAATQPLLAPHPDDSMEGDSLDSIKGRWRRAGRASVQHQQQAQLAAHRRDPAPPSAPPPRRLAAAIDAY